MNSAVPAADVYSGFERKEKTVISLGLENAYNRMQFDETSRPKTMLNKQLASSEKGCKGNVYVARSKVEFKYVTNLNGMLNLS